MGESISVLKNSTMGTCCNTEQHSGALETSISYVSKVGTKVPPSAYTK